MKKETQKEKIARLEHEVESLKATIANYEVLINQKCKQINKLMDNGEDSFKNSQTYMQMKDRIGLLEALHEADMRLSDIRNAKPHNERHAGRKPTITQDEITLMETYRAQGMTYKAIGEKTGYSHTAVFNCLKRK